MLKRSAASCCVVMRVAAIVAGIGAMSAASLARPEPQPEATKPDAAPPDAQPSDAAPASPGIPPSQKLGLRAALVRARLPVNPIVVIVPDARSYVAAIDRWRFDAGVRHPVLVDDGSWLARRAIARFVRAFKPKSVVRWMAPQDAAAWPADAPGRQAAIERTAAAAWLPSGDHATVAAVKDRWKQLQFQPPGLVVASATDPAWPAALALAAARGQLLVWVDAAALGRPDGSMSPGDAAGLAAKIQTAAEASGYSWEKLGDDIEAITVCLNCATKVYLGEKDQRSMLSLTDWLGRKPGDPPEKAPEVTRWAWAGQIIGNEWQSAYAAMSSLFLTTDTAWLFDGYEPTAPWNKFDATEAATTLEKAGIACTVDDDAGRSIATWRKRTSRGIDAGLICVNSSGNQDFFDLKPGQGRPCDVPILKCPAMVHFVHSWSAAAPSDPGTVAGRWLVRGAYAYVGSVHEPYLQAFVPTPKLAARLAAGLPLGAAARLDVGEVWKVSVLGDPLTTLGKTGPIVDSKGIPEGATDVAVELAEAVKARDYQKALADLALLGRDEDAAQLIRAVLKEDRDKVTPDAALEALASSFFAGDADDVAAVYRAAQPRLGDDRAARELGLSDARDMLWQSLWPLLGKLTREQAELLAVNLRAQTLVRDTGEAYSAVHAAIGADAAKALVARAAGLAASDAERRQIEQTGR